MRRAFSLLGARATVALVLIILVGGVVALAKALGDRAPVRSGVQAVEVEPTRSTVDPTAGDDSVPDAELTNPPTDPAITNAARTFVAAWLRRDLSPTAWHAGLTKLSTAELLDLLQGVDPKAVPANRTTGDPVLAVHTDGFAKVSVPVDSGTVNLELVLEQGKWLVNGVDWGRA